MKGLYQYLKLLWPNSTNFPNSPRKKCVLHPISWYTDQTIFSKLTPASDIWQFFTLLLISKKCISAQLRILGQNPDFWKHCNYDRKTGNTNNLFEKSILAYILWYHRIRIVWFILHETLFQKLNLTQNMARLFKEKIAICMACCSKLGQFF